MKMEIENIRKLKFKQHHYGTNKQITYRKELNGYG